MLQLLINLSGILAIFIAWTFVVFPALKYGINPRKETITSATCLSNIVSKFVTFGLIVGAIFQVMFIFYLVGKFQIPLFSIGNILYLTTNLATISVAIFHFNKHPKLHRLFATYYFFIFPLSLGLISYTIGHNYLFIFSLIIILLYFIGEAFLFIKFKECAYLEILAFFLLSIWTILLIFV